jgi:hypothetical protein
MVSTMIRYGIALTRKARRVPARRLSACARSPAHRQARAGRQSTGAAWLKLDALR